MTAVEGIKKELVTLLQEKTRRTKYKQIESYYPASGPYSRSAYPKHMAFFKAGKDYSERAFIAANRVGKTYAGGIELVYHVTGLYPDWWQGKRFTRPIKAWVGSLTPAQMKEAVQNVLFGNFADKGTGLIPRQVMLDDAGEPRTWNMPGVPNVVGTALIRHFDDNGDFDGWSQIEFKTYEQGWEKFKGAKVDVIWLDEEPKDHKIYSECATRTAGDTGDTGIIYCTFTPLLGFSDTVLSFLPGGQLPKGGVDPAAPWKIVINAGWDDVPHLDEDWKAQRLSSYSPTERDARTKGIPTKGSGAIYPVDEEDIVVAPFSIPSYWPRAFGMDFGWTHPTAVVWGAQDPESKTIYLYSEHKLGRSTPPIHAEAIKHRGKWIQGACDPAGGGSSQRDGTKLIDDYLLLDIDLIPSPGGPNSKEPRISKVLTMLESGQIKVFDTLVKWLEEYRIYRRDENGKIVKDKDDLMDATQYLVSEWDYIKDEEPDPDAEPDIFEEYMTRTGKSEVTGY